MVCYVERVLQDLVVLMGQVMETQLSLFFPEYMAVKSVSSTAYAAEGGIDSASCMQISGVWDEMLESPEIMYSRKKRGER